MLDNFIFLFQTVDGVNEKSQSLFDIIWGEGGIGGILGMGVLAVLFVLAVIAIYIFVERLLTIQKAANVDEGFMNNIRANVAAGNIAGAKALCQNTDSPVARMVEKGLMRIGKPLNDIDAAIENVGNLEIFKLEKNLSRLASIAGAAPMIGFFGTVTGMILAFYKMSEAGNVGPKELASGIYVALITTAVGLAIGIFAFIGYNLLVANVEKAIFKMERSTVEFMDLLQEPAS